MPCPLCDDTGWKPADAPSTSSGKRASAGSGRRVVRCDCWRENIGRQRLADANIPKRYQHCTLGNFTAYNESLERAVQGASTFAAAFPNVNRGLFFEGEPGVGKTHLAAAVLTQVVRTTGAHGLFYDVRELLKLIRSTYNASIQTTELEVLAPVLKAELLVLDDLGAEKTSEWVEETMNLIVNTRYNEKLATIFTSNFPDIPDDTEPNSLLCRIGHRMRSRLHEMCEFRVLDAGDYRQLPSNGGVDDLMALWAQRKDLARKRGGLPARAAGPARARLRDGKGDLKWPGGRAGS
jgi:DNA replication protein DnaC